jgi:copper(I)-binding protein
MRSLTKALALGAALTLAAAGTALAGDATAGNIKITDAWARASAGPAQNGAAFLTVTNGGGEADKLVAAGTDVAATAELHTHLNEGGVMKMRQVPAIDLPAGQKVTLQPGGYHVMIMGLKAPLKAGETFPLTLTFEKAGKVTVDVAVGAAGAMGPVGMDHGGMSHGAMDHGHMGGQR